MQKFLGLAIIAFGIFLEVLWLGFCFGSIIIGILLLIFAPGVLFFPFNFFLVIGLSILNPGKYSSSSRFKYQRSYQQQGNSHQQGSYAPPRSNLDKYYEVLESSKTDSFEQIKANYRRLMKEYHYDSIASKNLPEDMVKFAEQKTQSINEAYSAIKEARG